MKQKIHLFASLHQEREHCEKKIAEHNVQSQRPKLLWSYRHQRREYNHLRILIPCDDPVWMLNSHPFSRCVHSHRSYQ
ncbi:unnamed protein product [Ceratitis capitata]|uniref:(Mediterranean fruit fly) hypothetical protein n=1 Tax=Ceratitis capitata TaxID=7213 RepID=A0A811UJK7_CERCA|nr:unnamed protein product [Ceratitis capitata]